MPGVGPAPKDPRKRAGKHGNNGIPTTLVRFEAGEQPLLPADIDWPPQTIAWWKMWGDSPLSEHFMTSDWSFLLDTALLHAMVWGSGELDKMPELRLRVAKFGATPEDRARLRIQFAEADGADGGQQVRGGGNTRQRRGALVALPTITPAGDPGAVAAE